MKKKFVVVFILFTLTHPVFSDENLALLFMPSYRFLWPGLEEQGQSGFVNTGVGLHYTIIPSLFTPGIYAEAGIGFGWFALFSADPVDKEVLEQLGLSLGFRVYNEMEIGIVTINMFTGYNFLVGQTRETLMRHSPVLGISLAVYFLGLEYAYYIPTKYSNDTKFQHISLIFHITDKIMKKVNQK